MIHKALSRRPVPSGLSESTVTWVMSVLSEKARHFSKLVHGITGWWFQPIWKKKYARQIGHLPQFSGWKFQIYLLSCHQPDTVVDSFSVKKHLTQSPKRPRNHIGAAGLMWIPLLFSRQSRTNPWRDSCRHFTWSYLRSRKACSQYEHPRGAACFWHLLQTISCQVARCLLLWTSEFRSNSELNELLAALTSGTIGWWDLRNSHCSKATEPKEKSKWDYLSCQTIWS